MLRIVYMPQGELRGAGHNADLIRRPDRQTGHSRGVRTPGRCKCLRQQIVGCGLRENDGERIEKTLVRRWFQVARWANRLSLLLPPERPRALRELAWTYAHSKKLAKSSKLLKLSCRKAEAMNAEYELAKSQYAMGLIARRQRIDSAEKIFAEAEKRVREIESLTNVE